MSWQKSLMLGLCLGLGCISGWAQEPQGEGAVPGEGEAPSEVRETTIYIPYERLRTLFEKEGRGVFLPYEKYRELWDAARRATARVPEAPIPARSVLARVDSQAKVEGEVVVVRSEVTIELLAKGWHEIPLGLAGSTLRSATLDGEPARLIDAGDGSQRLLVQHEEETARTVILAIEYAAVPQKLPGVNQVTFQPPRAPIHRWRIVLPEDGTEIKMTPDVRVRRVQPNESASTVPGSDTEVVESGVTESDEGVEEPSRDVLGAVAGEEVEAFVGAAQTVGFSWTAKAEGAAGLAALVTVSTTQEVVIEEGVVRTRNTLAYDISRADVDRLILEVPAEHDVVNVFDPNVRRWEKSVVDGVQRLEVVLFQPTRGTQGLVIDLERFVGGREMMSTMVQTEIHAPLVKAVGAGAGEAEVSIGRQQGLVVARLATSLRGEVIARSGLLQVDATQLPAALAGSTWDFAYRYVGVPYDLGLRVEKVSPEISTKEWVEVRLSPTLLEARSVASIDVARAGVFQIEWEIPAGYEVKRVEGIGVEGGEPAAIDAHELKAGSGEEAPARLVIALGRQALGRIGILVTVERKLSEPALLEPTDVAVEMAIPVPRVATSTTLRSTGEMVVLGGESLRLDARRTGGVRPGAADLSLGPMPSDVAATALRFVGRWSFDRERVDLVYAASRRRPYVEARQTLEVDVQEGTARYQTTLHFEVRYSGVEQIRMDVPSEIASKLVNVDDELRDRQLDPQPDDVPEGYVAWSLTADDELLGEKQVSFTWESPLGDLPVGRGVEIAVPRLRLPGVDRFWGQVIARKAESIEMGTAGVPVGLRPIDPRSELIEGVDSEGVARAFEFQGDWSLSLQATRYELEEVKRTSVEAALVRAVVTRSDRIAVQAIYRLRSARQRIAIELPGVDAADSGAALDAQPLRVAGKNVALERDETRFYIPFLGHSAEEAVVVELRYTLPVSGTIRVPEFPEDPAIQRVDLWVYLPDDRLVVGQSGPWSHPESGWLSLGSREWDDESKVWQRIHGDSAALPFDDFPVDGERFAFTTLRPERGEGAGLSLRTVNRTGWDVGIVVLLIGLGLVLAWRPLHERFLVTAILVVGFLAAGVWEPWTLVSCLRSTTWVAIGAVIGLWLLKGTYGVLQTLIRGLSSSSSPTVAISAPAAGGVVAGGAVAGGAVLVMSDDASMGAESKVTERSEGAGGEAVSKEALPETSPRDFDRDVGTGGEPGDTGASGERKE